MRRRQSRPRTQIGDVAERPARLAACHQCGSDMFRQAVDLPEAEAQGQRARLLQRVVPHRMVHIGRQHLHAVFARVAHNLSRGIEAHRLRIEQRAGEGSREMAFEPA